MADTRTPDTSKGGPADMADYSPSSVSASSPDSSSIVRTRTPDSSTGASTPTAFDPRRLAHSRTADSCGAAFCDGDH